MRVLTGALWTRLKLVVRAVNQVSVYLGNSLTREEGVELDLRSWKITRAGDSQWLMMIFGKSIFAALSVTCLMIFSRPKVVYSQQFCNSQLFSPSLQGNSPLSRHTVHLHGNFTNQASHSDNIIFLPHIFYQQIPVSGKKQCQSQWS